MTRRTSSRDASKSLGATQVSGRLVLAQASFGSSTRRIGVASQVLRFGVRRRLSQSRCLSLLLAMASRACLLFPPRGHKPPLTPLPLTPSLSSSPLCQTPGRRSVGNRSTISPSRPVLFALHPRFPNMIRFGNRPPLIRLSASAHKSLIVRNSVPMLSYRVISRTRMYEVIRGYVSFLFFSFLYLEMSFFPNIFCTIAVSSLYGEYVVRSFLPGGAFSTL